MQTIHLKEGEMLNPVLNLTLKINTKHCSWCLISNLCSTNQCQAIRSVEAKCDLPQY
jgi:hypothetical protein